MKSLAIPYAFFMNSRALLKIEAQMKSGLGAELGVKTRLNNPEAIAAHICLCRDKCPTVRLILKPHSIMILGGGKRWWPTAEDRLASVLKKGWHHVIFAESR